MNRSPRGVALVVIAAMLLLTAGCMGGGGPGEQANGGGNGNGNASGNGNGNAAAADQSEEVGATADRGGIQASQRSIIRSGSVELEVNDFDDTQQTLTRTVREHGGFVSDSRIETDERDNETYKSGEIVVRVPQQNFSLVVEQAQAMGDLQSVNIESEDVTDQLVDLNARLENLRAERERLRALYENASDTAAVLDVQDELSDVQEEIETLEAEQKSLERQVALSTLQVRMREPQPDSEPIDAEDWTDTPVLVAFLESVNNAVASVQTLIVAIAYALPYLVVYVPLIGGAFYGVMRLRRWRSGSSSAPVTTPIGTADEGDSPSEDDDSPEDGDESTE